MAVLMQVFYWIAEFPTRHGVVAYRSDERLATLRADWHSCPLGLISLVSTNEDAIRQISFLG
jgi:hypothetical protein